MNNRQLVLFGFRKEGPMTTAQAAKTFGLPIHSVKSAVWHLREAGQLEVVDTDVTSRSPRGGRRPLIYGIPERSTQ